MVVKSVDPLNQSTGLLCIVDGIKKAKIQLSVLPCTTRRKISVAPEEIIDSGEYGDDENETSDDIDAAYKDFSAGKSDVLSRQISNIAQQSENAALADRYYDAMKMYYEGLFERSIEIASEVARDCPNQTQKGSCYALAYRCSLALSNKEQANQFAFQSVSYNNDSVSALCDMGDVCLQMEQLAQSSTWYSRALDTDPRSPVARYSMARLLHHQGHAYREECIRHLVACVTSCRQADEDCTPEKLTGMYISVAEMLNNLGCDAELCTKALLRAVNFARNCGALKEGRPFTVVGTKSIARELQNFQVRVKAAEAFFALGNLLRSLGQAVHATHNQNSSPRDSLQNTVSNGVGAGYMQGAFGAYFMSNSLTGGSNVLYRSHMEDICHYGPL